MSHAPQEYIEKSYDLRLTIIGHSIFACKIDATRSNAGRVDWRAYDLANTRTPRMIFQQKYRKILLVFARS